MSIETVIVLALLLVADLVLLLACLGMRNKLHHAAEMLDLETEAARQRAMEDEEAAALNWELANITERIKENII